MRKKLRFLLMLLYLTDYFLAPLTFFTLNRGILSKATNILSALEQEVALERSSRQEFDGPYQ